MFTLFAVCAADFEMDDGLCLDPNRPRRYNLQKRDTTITADGAIINLHVRVHSSSHQSNAVKEMAKNLVYPLLEVIRKQV